MSINLSAISPNFTGFIKNIQIDSDRNPNDLSADDLYATLTNPLSEDSQKTRSENAAWALYAVRQVSAEEVFSMIKKLEQLMSVDPALFQKVRARFDLLSKLPPAALDLGFGIGRFEGGGEYLSFPALAPSSDFYASRTADINDGASEFIALTFDKASNTLTVKTNQGEQVAFKINPQNNTLTLTDLISGQSAPMIYEPNAFVRSAYERLAHLLIKDGSPLYGLSRSNNSLAFVYGEKEIARMEIPADAARDFNFEIIGGFILKISPKNPRQAFSASSPLGGQTKDRALLITLNPFTLESEKPSIMFSLGGLSSGFRDFNEMFNFINNNITTDNVN